MFANSRFIEVRGFKSIRMLCRYLEEVKVDSLPYNGRVLDVVDRLRKGEIEDIEVSLELFRIGTEFKLETWERIRLTDIAHAYKLTRVTRFEYEDMNFSEARDTMREDILASIFADNLTAQEIVDRYETLYPLVVAR